MWQELLGALIKPVADAYTARVQAKHDVDMKQK
jgi:hypothetical protein